MAKVVIGVDPHKLSATIEVVDEQEKVLATGGSAPTRPATRRCARTSRRGRDRVWAVEGSNGAGRPLAQRLLADGEHVVDVPAKLAARARLFDTGHNRKTDAHDAHAVAVAAVRTQGPAGAGLRRELEALRMLVDRRDELSRRRVQTVNRLHRLLAELMPGHGEEGPHRPAGQGDPRRGAAPGPRRQDPPPVAAEELAELVAVEKKIKALTTELKADGASLGLDLMDLHGVGPVVAARILADVGDVARFADRNRFASWTGTAPLDASSGEQSATGCPGPGTGG